MNKDVLELEVCKECGVVYDLIIVKAVCYSFYLDKQVARCPACKHQVWEEQ